MQVSLTDIRKASQRLASVVHRTPVLHSRQLDERAGCPVLLKAENFQRAGAFKIRGAYNFIAQLTQASRRQGVISYSSGNHAQGVALAASLLQTRATIVVPETILAAKRAATLAYGAQIVTAGSTSAERQSRAEELAAEKGLSLVPPYDHAHIVAGQGTVGLELLEAEPDLDCVVLPIGGGGLIAGCAVALKSLKPGLRVVGVEPADGNDTFLSLQAGHRVRIPGPSSIADGLRAVEPGAFTFPYVQEFVDEVVLVTDDEIRATCRFLLERLKILVEPSGAVSLSALLAGRITPAPVRAGVVLSGGNVDLASLPDLLGHGRT